MNSSHQTGLPCRGPAAANTQQHTQQLRITRRPTPTRAAYSASRLATTLAATMLMAGLANPALAQKGAAKGADAVVKRDGSRVRGVEVTEFAVTGIKAAKGKDTVEIPGHQIVAVEWGELPDGFLAARSAMDRGDYANAAQLFGEAERQTERALIKADALFFQVKAAVAAAGTDKAAAATAADRAKAWLGANANHWRLPEALLLAGRAQRLSGNFADATTTLRDLDDRATRDGFGPVWGARAKFELAMSLFDANKATEARTAFQTASSAADGAMGSPNADVAELRLLKTLAKVGEGETFIGEKQWSKAESFFSGLTRSDQPELAAAGRAGEGEAIYHAAVERKSMEDLRRAQVALAGAAVLDSLSGEASAKANFYLAKCLLALGAEREGDNFKARAHAYFQIVANNYQTSRWAALARAEMTK
jgi:hypothetical protein